MHSYRTATIPFAKSRWWICVSVMPKGVDAPCDEVAAGAVVRFHGGSGGVSSSSDISTSMIFTGRARRGLSVELILAEEQRPAKRHAGAGGLNHYILDGNSSPRQRELRGTEGQVRRAVALRADRRIKQQLWTSTVPALMIDEQETIYHLRCRAATWRSGPLGKRFSPYS